MTVNVPKDASPGDHDAGIDVAGTISDAAWAQLQPQLGGGINLRSRIAFPLTVLVRVPGTVVNGLPVDFPIPALVTTWTGDYTAGSTSRRNTGLSRRA